MFSNKTSWERNDNYYFVSQDLHGPWKNQGLFCPEGTLTHNSQCSFVFSLERDGKTVPIYMGDRWSYPNQRSEEHTSELQSRGHLVCRLLLEKNNPNRHSTTCTSTRWRW